MTLLDLVEGGGVVLAGLLMLILGGLWRQRAHVRFCARDCSGCDERCAVRAVTTAYATHDCWLTAAGKG